VALGRVQVLATGGALDLAAVRHRLSRWWSGRTATVAAALCAAGARRQIRLALYRAAAGDAAPVAAFSGILRSPSTGGRCVAAAGGWSRAYPLFQRFSHRDMARL